MKRILMGILLILGLALLVTACSDDDPVEPNIPPPYPYVATTPDSLMGLYRLVLEEMDGDHFPLLFTEDFRMWLDPAEGDYGDVPATYLARDEVLLAGANMFGGEAVTNWQGDGVPGVTRFTIHEWTRITDWEQPKSGDETPPPLPNETVSSLWSLRMFVERGIGYSMLAVAGRYEIQAEKQPTDDDHDLWAIRYIDPVSDGKSESLGWVGVNLLYLTNEAPTAVIDVTETPTDTWPEYTFDPKGSSDEDSGLADLPYRWREGGEIFIGDPPPWSEWTTEPYSVTFESEEEQTVNLEVRDRWGATARASKSVTPVKAPLPYPDSPTQLMANFKDAYEGMDFEELARIIHPDFQMILQQGTIDYFPDVGTTLDASEELRIADRMFSGEDLADPAGYLLVGLETIDFDSFYPVGDWQPSPPDDLIPDALFTTYEVDFRFSRGPTFTTLLARDQVRFYVTSRDSLHEGTNQPFYQMIGQVDLTRGFKAVEEINFGSIKALWR